jgi:hypothetical protein
MTHKKPFASCNTEMPLPDTGSYAPNGHGFCGQITHDQ